MATDKLRQLRELIRSYGSCLVAYSGGVDSVFLARVARTGIGHQLGVDVGKTARERHRLRARVQAQEVGVGAAVPGMADFLAQRVRQTHLAQARREGTTLPILSIIVCLGQPRSPFVHGGHPFSYAESGGSRPSLSVIPLAKPPFRPYTGREYQ